MSKLAIIILCLSCLLALLGVAGYLLWRALKEEKLNGFFTKHGLHILPSTKTTFIPARIYEEWTEWVVDFWNKAEGWDKELLYNVLDKTTIILVDKEKIEHIYNGVTYHVVGLTQVETKNIYIASYTKGTKEVDEERILSLFKHETSHIVAAVLKNLWTNEDSHAFFKEKNLGA